MGIRFFSNRKDYQFKENELISNVDGFSLKYNSTRRSGGGSNAALTGFTILAGPGSEVGKSINMIDVGTYLFTPDSTYTLEFGKPFTVRWELVGEGKNGNGGRGGGNTGRTSPTSPNPGDPTVLSNPNFTLTAGGGTGGYGGGGGAPGPGAGGGPGTGGVGSFSNPGGIPGTYANINGLSGGGAGGGSGDDNQGYTGGSANSVYNGSTIPPSNQGGPNTGGGGGEGVGGGATPGSGGGGGGAGTGAYVSLDTHITQTGTYTLTVGDGNAGAVIIFQSA